MKFQLGRPSRQRPRPARQDPPAVKQLSRRGLTSFEMLITLTIIAAFGVLVVPALARRRTQAADQITRSSLTQLRKIVMTDYRPDMYESLPYPADNARVQHPQLVYLYENPAAALSGNPNSIEEKMRWSYDPASSRGWSGPYTQESVKYQINAVAGFDTRYGVTGDLVPADGWGRPIVLQQPVTAGSDYSAISINYARLVSAGQDGILQTSPTVLEPAASTVGDDIIVYLRSR